MSQRLPYSWLTLEGEQKKALAVEWGVQPLNHNNQKCKLFPNNRVLGCEEPASQVELSEVDLKSVGCQSWPHKNQPAGKQFSHTKLDSDNKERVVEIRIPPKVVKTIEAD